MQLLCLCQSPTDCEQGQGELRTKQRGVSLEASLGLQVFQPPQSPSQVHLSGCANSCLQRSVRGIGLSLSGPQERDIVTSDCYRPRLRLCAFPRGKKPQKAQVDLSSRTPRVDFCRQAIFKEEGEAGGQLSPIPTVNTVAAV